MTLDILCIHHLVKAETTTAHLNIKPLTLPLRHRRFMAALLPLPSMKPLIGQPCTLLSMIY